MNRILQSQFQLLKLITLKRYLHRREINLNHMENAYMNYKHLNPFFIYISLSLSLSLILYKLTISKTFTHTHRHTYEYMHTYEPIHTVKKDTNVFIKGSAFKGSSFQTYFLILGPPSEVFFSTSAYFVNGNT